MTKQILTRLACLFILLIAMALQAEEEKAVADSTEAAAKSATDNTEQHAVETEQTISEPQAENLKNRNLGAAFRSFRPSEEISADNAVPFPVDI